jgi:ABC-type transport system involved in cytochrome bd biosynthesis fused ATPase/permease subunit
LQARGKTVVFVTNAIDYTDESDRVIVVDNGRIV